MRRNDSLLDLFLELQILDRIPRAGYTLRGVHDPESVTEHSWHVLFLVWALAPRIEGIDRQRAVEIALVHDLAELRVGDLPLTASRYFPAGAKKAAELAALADVLAPLPERAQAEDTALWRRSRASRSGIRRSSTIACWARLRCSASAR